MKFSLHIPVGDIAPGQYQSMEAIRQMAGALEAAKVDACFVTDHPAPDAAWLHASGHDALEPFTSLAFIAAASTRLLLHANVVVLPYRNPFITAKAAATLHVLSGGRLIMGAGVGYQKGEFDALGVDFHKRGAMTDEALETIRLAWAGGAVVKQGPQFNFNAHGVEPRPAPNPPPKIWIGGNGDKAVERAARWGDGWCPFFGATASSQRSAAIQSTAELKEKVARAKALRAEQGKSGAFDFVIGARVIPRNRTREEAEQMRHEVGELAEVGLNWLFVYVGEKDRADYLENVQWFGAEVVARL